MDYFSLPEREKKVFIKQGKGNVKQKHFLLKKKKKKVLFCTRQTQSLFQAATEGSCSKGGVEGAF